MSGRRRWLASAAALVVITSLLLAGVLKLPLSRLDVPYTFAGDTVEKLAQIHNVAETGWLFHSDRLGYPFGYDRLDFPRFDSLNYAIMGPVAALTGETGLAMNLYFIAGFYLIGLAALFSFRRLGLGIGPALLCALLYAFLPYHVQRGVTHVTNGAYFLVPLGMLVLAWLARGRLGGREPGLRRRWLFALSVAILLPLQTPYNGVFFACLCGVAGAIAMAQRSTWRVSLPALVLLATVAASFLAEQVPAIIHKQAAGEAASVAKRTPFEAEMYSLHLNQVLLPTTGHRIPAVAAAKRGFDHDMKLDAPFYEIRNQYIGLLGVLGFVALFWGLARGASGPGVRKSGSEDDADINVRIFALFATAIVLLAISSGLGNLIAYWVTTKIRAYNRILPFFAFACLFGAGWLMQSLLARIGNTVLRQAALAGVGVFALLDVISPAEFGDRAANVAGYDSDHAYFQSVEHRLGAGAAVFQLPVVWYPEHPPVNRMGDYEEFKPFLLSRSLRISYGGSHGRAGYAWGTAVEKLPPVHLIGEAHRMGFAAILIDGRAYANDALLQEATGTLEQLLQEPPSISPDHRWWLFPLAGCCGPPVAQIAPGMPPPAFGYDLDGPPLRFTSDGNGLMYSAGGWAEPGDWGTWSLGSEARLRLQIGPGARGPLLLSLQTRALLGPKLPQRHLRIVCNDQVISDIDYTLPTAIKSLHLELPAGLVGADGLLNIRFIVTPEGSPQSAGVNEDRRPLGIGLTELGLTPADSIRPMP